MKLELIATATFGLEAVVKREIQALGYRIIKSEDGKITYMGDERAVVRSNLWLRSADRVLLKMAEFKALEFEELFQQTRGLPWEELIPMDGKFTVTGTSVKSKLHSVPACQSIVKKAVVERLREYYCVERFEETGAEYTIKVTLLKDNVTLTVDTSGPGLHKRATGVCDVAAPIKETPGGCHGTAVLLARRTAFDRSVLRKRDDPHRGGHDRTEYRAGPEPQLCRGRLGNNTA